MGPSVELVNCSHFHEHQLMNGWCNTQAKHIAVAVPQGVPSSLSENLSAAADLWKHDRTQGQKYLHMYLQHEQAHSKLLDKTE